MDYSYNCNEYTNPCWADPYQVEYAQNTQQVEYDQVYPDAFQPYSQQHSSFSSQPHFDAYQLQPSHQQYQCPSIVYGESNSPNWPQEGHGQIIEDSHTEHFVSVPQYTSYQQPPNNYFQPVSSVSPDSNHSGASGSNDSTHSSLVEAEHHPSGYYAPQSETPYPRVNHDDATVCYESVPQPIQSRNQSLSQPRQSHALISYVPLGSQNFGPVLPVRKARSRINTPKKPDHSGTKKTIFTDFQFKVLQQRFSLGTNATRLESITLAKNLNLTETQVLNWFANRKKRSLLVDFDITEEDFSQYWTPIADGEKVSISLNDLSKGQLEELHKKFSEDHRLTGLERKEFAKQIDANEKTVELWFARQRKIFKNQNRMRLFGNNAT